MFVDDDFLWLGDIADLLDYCDDKYALICVKHDYKPSVTTSWPASRHLPPQELEQQTAVELLPPANQNVSLSMINKEGGAFLHGFSWIEDDSLIGEVPYHWNFLVDWYTPYTEEEIEKSGSPGPSTTPRAALVPRPRWTPTTRSGSRSSGPTRPSSRRPASVPLREVLREGQQAPGGLRQLGRLWAWDQDN